MHKTSWTLALLLCLGLLLSGCDTEAEETMEEGVEVPYTPYRTDADLREHADRLVLIESYEALLDYLDEAGEIYDFGPGTLPWLETHDEAFFEDYRLALAVLAGDDESFSEEVVRVRVAAGRLHIDIARDVDVGDDVSCWHLSIALARDTFDVDAQKTPRLSATSAVEHRYGTVFTSFRTNTHYEREKPLVRIVESQGDLDDLIELLEAKEGTSALAALITALEKTPEDHFDTRILVLVHLVEPSGSIRHRFDRLESDEGVLTLHLKRHIPQIGTTDMASWHVLLDVMPEEPYDTVVVEVDNVFENAETD